ncbi:MAG: zf-HC2 domain-containing protein [Anaerolineales bacterium]|nr:zf-HC2 domain-containing protein [Anaerolineales bacterium]
MHLTDEQLNEYLDNETNEREQIELHLHSCNECNARFSDLQNLFLELDSLPDLQLTRDLSTRFATKGQLTLQLPHWLTLTVFAQAALALIALIISIPFITTYIPQIDVASLTSPLFEIQSLWNTWLDSLSTLQLPTIPELPIPVLEMSSLLLALAGIFVIWIFGNGLLLRNQIR